VQRLLTLVWERVPQRVGRLSRTLGVAFGEGVYVTAWPRLAAVMPVMALLLGVMAGWRRLDGPQVFTQSLLIMGLAIGLGIIAGQLGALFTLGYAVGDLLLWRHPEFLINGLTARLLLIGGSLVVYVALGMLAVGVPLTVRALRAQTPLPSPERADARVVAETVLGGVSAAILTFLYVQALPMLIRPLFIWQGQVPSVASVAPSQRLAWVFAIVALVVGSARVLVEYGAGVIDPGGIQRRVAALDALGPSLMERVPAVVRVVVAAVIGTGMLSGLLTRWADAVVLLVGLLVVNAIRTLLPPLVPAWPSMVERVPVVLRLPAGMVLGFVVAARVATGRLVGTSFLPLIWGFLAALACMALLFPDRRPATSDTARAGT
jgi:hypothetical protein